MRVIQAASIPEAQKSHLAQMNRDFRASLSYVSFYSADSPFVVQSIQKLHRELSKVLAAVTPLVFHWDGQNWRVNDQEAPDFKDLATSLLEKDRAGFEVSEGVTLPDLSSFVRDLALPTAKLGELGGESRLRWIEPDDLVELVLPKSDAPPVDGDIPGSSTPSEAPEELFPPHSREAQLALIAEAWQHAQLQKKNMAAAPEMAEINRSFDRLFDRLLDRMEGTSPEFDRICQWFRSPAGDLMENETVASMFPLVETAVLNGWTAVLFDPATEGLVNDCLAHWGANGRHDLVDRTVAALAGGLDGDIVEKQIALTHLMDARPWVQNGDLLEKVLGRMISLLAQETFPGLYQSALLSAWDLIEPAIAQKKEPQVLSLLSTLHFHADEDLPGFPERAAIARHWLFERSTPELVRLFVKLAFQAGQLRYFPLLGEMAAPVLLHNYLKEGLEGRSGFDQLFAEIKAPVRSALGEWLAEPRQEEEVRQVLPILRICGLDAPLSFLLSSWISRGSRELKLDLLGMIEGSGDRAGGPALRLALFDDEEEIASLAARVMGKIQYTQGIPALLKAAKVREGRFSQNDSYWTSLCRTLGELRSPGTLEFLRDIARKKPLLGGRNFPLPVRLEAVRAITRIERPEAWEFVESLMEEKNPKLQEELGKIIQERAEHPV